MSAAYTVPTTIDATVSYELAESWSVYGSFENALHGYHLDGNAEYRRLFFSQRRLEGGLVWSGTDAAEIRIAAGWAFEQEFNRGFDVLDTTTIRKITDEPYLRVVVRLGF